jgi:glycine/D-amino acid oxidase-like deaminating enzyme
MIQRDGCNISVWQDSVDAYRPVNKAEFSTLYDVVIVGGGITGITSALLMQNAGLKCLVIEASSLCFGTTGGTTAHINTLLDVPYSTIEKKFSKEKAKLVADSVKEAVATIKQNVRKYDIDCEYEETTATLFAKTDKQKNELDKISQATADAGIENEFVIQLNS